jgi:hypothetical protein
MLSSIVKDKIKMYMSVQDFLCDKRMPTDANWDKYFIENYNNNVQIEVYNEDFITYEVMWNCIFIKDFVSEKGSGIMLFNHVLRMAKIENKPICAFIHKTNVKLLQIVQKRYGFKIGSTVGNQYLVIKE